MVLRTSDRLCIPSEVRIVNESHELIVFRSTMKRGITSVDLDELNQCIKDIRAAYKAVVTLSRGLPPDDMVKMTDILTEKIQTKLIHDQLSNNCDVVHEDQSEQSDVIQENISGKSDAHHTTDFSGLAASITESMA